MRTVSPTTFSIEIPKVEAALLPKTYVRCGTGDLARDERPATARALVVEEDAVARIHAVRFAVVDCYPVAVELGDTVRGTRVEWSCFALRRFDDLAVQLGRRSLVEPYVLLKTTCTNGIEETESA